MNGIIESQTLAQNQSKRMLLVLFYWYLLMPGRKWLENRRRTFIQPSAMVTFLRAWGLLEVLLDDFGVWFARSFRCSLSLSVEEGRSTFGGVVGILAKF